MTATLVLLVLVVIAAFVAYTLAKRLTAAAKWTRES